MKPCKNKLSLSVFNLRPLDAGRVSVQRYFFETALQNKAWPKIIRRAWLLVAQLQMGSRPRKW